MKAASATRPIAHPCNFAHEGLATDALNPDGTLHSDNRLTEPQLRQRRNDMIKEQLQSGQPVAFRSRGKSLWPLVHSGDLCEYDPVFDASDVQVGDVIFCQVYPSREYHAHLIMSKTYCGEVEAWYFTVENQSGRENGWCWLETIYGKLKQTCRPPQPLHTSMVRLRQPAR